MARPLAATNSSMGPRLVAGNTGRGPMLREFAQKTQNLIVCSAKKEASGLFPPPRCGIVWLQWSANKPG